MKNILISVLVCVMLVACSSAPKQAAAPKPQEKAAKPSDRLLAADDLHVCEQQLGVAQPKTASDLYVMSSDSLDKIKECAFSLEKQRMPLLADLIDQYRQMLHKGNEDCTKDLGTHYAGTCLQNSLSDARNWYDMAVTQRIESDLPGQPQLAPAVH